MASASILMILALLILVALFLARPFLQSESFDEIEEDQYSGLLAERERIIEALLELDFDQELGKIPEDIYPARREELLQQGAQILQLLDELGQAQSLAEIESGEDGLEALIAARKAERGK